MVHGLGAAVPAYCRSLLAAHEGIFSLSNPGHVLFGGGLALVVAGIGLMLLAGGRRSRLVRYASAGALAALSLGALGLAATSEGGLRGHPHSETVHVHEDGTNHTHEQHEVFLKEQGAAPATAAAGSHDHAADSGQSTGFGAFGANAQSRHQHQPDVAISLADLDTMQEQIAAARAGTEKYLDVREALKDGFVQVTQDLPLIAAHFASVKNVADGVFDPTKPEILLYAKRDGQWQLVGLSYTAPFTGSDTPPDGFAGPLDVWHYHTNLCFSGQRVVSATMTAEQCRQARGRLVANTGWMAHLWIYLESPEGVFAHQNSLLTGSGAVLTRAEIAAMQ